MRPFQQLLDLAERSDIPSDLRHLRSLGLSALIDGLGSVLPRVLIPRIVRLSGNSIHFPENLSFSLEKVPQIVIVGGGKATGEMASALVAILGDSVRFRGVINVPHEQTNLPRRLTSPNGNSAIEVNFSAHPVPDEAGQKGVQAMLDLIHSSPPSTLVIALISGGGSALMPYPAKGISLADKQQTNRLLLSCGADITEINTVRKHLSAFKGGQLARACHPRPLVSLILSDVIGNDLQTICSGPTVPDRTTFRDTYNIFEKYRILDKLPVAVVRHVKEGLAGRVQETPKEGDKCFEFARNFVIGSAETAAVVVKEQLEKAGMIATIYSNCLQGEASEYGKKLYHELLPKFARTYPHHPAAFIGTGEFTVTLKGRGKGGRNQEMLLSFLVEAAFSSSVSTPFLRRFVIISAAFDGMEGNSGCMGAVIDSSSPARAKEKLTIEQNLDLSAALAQNNSKAIFEALSDLLVTGYTGTNVNDMTIILVQPESSALL